MRVYEQLLASAVIVVARLATARPLAEVVARRKCPAGRLRMNGRWPPAHPRSFHRLSAAAGVLRLPRSAICSSSWPWPGAGGAALRAIGSNRILCCSTSTIRRWITASGHVVRSVLYACNQPVSQAGRPHSPQRSTAWPNTTWCQTAPGRWITRFTRSTRLPGDSARGANEQEFLPFYASYDRIDQRQQRAYYTLHRLPRLLSRQQRRDGPRSSYVGSEVFVSLVDADEAPYRGNLRQLAVTTLCTNRDLPLLMPIGRGDTDFALDTGAPVGARALAGTDPAAAVHRARRHRLAAHQSSVAELSVAARYRRPGARRGAARDAWALRQPVGPGRPPDRSKECWCGPHPVSPGVMPIPGPIASAAACRSTLRWTIPHSRGSACSCSVAVLEQFFAKYASLNSASPRRSSARPSAAAR